MLAKATALLLLPIVVAAIAGRLISIRALIANSFAQSLPLTRGLFRRVWLVLHVDLGEIRHTTGRQLGCDHRISVVAGPRLSHPRPITSILADR